MKPASSTLATTNLFARSLITMDELEIGLAGKIGSDFFVGLNKEFISKESVWTKKLS